MTKIIQSKGKETVESSLMYLNELPEGSSSPIIVMVYRKWDVTNVNGRYMSTDYIVTVIFVCVRYKFAYYFIVSFVYMVK